MKAWGDTEDRINRIWSASAKVQSKVTKLQTFAMNLLQKRKGENQQVHKSHGLNGKCFMRFVGGRLQEQNSNYVSSIVALEYPLTRFNILHMSL